ncbi:hypothetical protein [Nocardioides sp.]|uniref:hypothetical protein n=1 Tax=Nocardioides sp. TaxID=35761 RepID=UPI0032190A2B
MKSLPAVRRLLVAVSGLALAGAGVLAPTAPVEAAPPGVVTVASAAGVATVSSSRDRLAKKKRKRSARHSDWAAAGQATITPGVMMYTAGAQCTANFVFTDAVGNVFVGYAAHCAGKGEATDTNGCQVSSQPLGTRVDFVSGGSVVSGGTTLGRGTLVYSSWLAMDEAGTTDGPTCEYNDFALVKVRARDIGKVNPSVPFYGGPTGIDKNGTSLGDRVYSYGNSSLRGGLELLSPKLGIAHGDTASDDGWNHQVYTLTPGIPGDSGSGFMNRAGKAVGTLSTVAIAPLPLANGTGDLLRELRFAKATSVIKGLRLAKGTEAFSSAL